MLFHRVFHKTFIQPLLILLCLIQITPVAKAGQEILLAELDPAKTALGVFHSYKHKTVLVSLVQTDQSLFKCLPNQYYFYNYGDERYFEVEAGNLKIDSDYTHIFRTRIHSLPDQKGTGQVIDMLSRTLKVPVDLITAARLKSLNPERICWQQPELMDTQNRTLRTFPFIAANLCKNQWCSELYWTSPGNIRFWIRNKPKQFQLVNLNTLKSTFTVHSTSAPFVRSNIPQLNAPRDNLVTPETLNGKVIRLKKSSNTQVELEWHKETSGKIVVRLIREGKETKRAELEHTKMLKLAKDESYAEALQTAKFALWLDPETTSVKLDRLKIFASLSLLNRFFESLQKDFTPSDRFKTCQTLHPDPAIRHLWTQKTFKEKFNKICNQ